MQCLMLSPPTFWSSCELTLKFIQPVSVRFSLSDSRGVLSSMMQFHFLLVLSSRLKEAHLVVRKQISRHAIFETTNCFESRCWPLSDLPGIWRVRKIFSKLSWEFQHDPPVTKKIRKQKKILSKLSFIIINSVSIKDLFKCWSRGSGFDTLSKTVLKWKQFYQPGCLALILFYTF